MYCARTHRDERMRLAKREAKVTTAEQDQTAGVRGHQRMRPARDALLIEGSGSSKKGVQRHCRRAFWFRSKTKGHAFVLETPMFEPLELKHGQKRHKA